MLELLGSPAACFLFPPPGTGGPRAEADRSKARREVGPPPSPPRVWVRTKAAAASRTFSWISASWLSASCLRSARDLLRCAGAGGGAGELELVDGEAWRLFIFFLIMGRDKQEQKDPIFFLFFPFRFFLGFFERFELVFRGVGGTRPWSRSR